MGLMDILKNPALLSLIKDQRLREIVTRREIRVSEENFHRVSSSAGSASVSRGTA